MTAMLLALTCASCTADSVVVESARLRLRADTQSGDWLALEDAATGFSYLAETASPTFQLQLTDAEGAQTWTDSRAADSVTVEEQRDGGVHRVTLSYLGVAEGVDARVTVAAPAGEQPLRLRIAIRNSGPQIVETVVFPVLHISRPLGVSDEDDRLFVPGGDGYVADAAGMERQSWHRRGYPGNASMQFSAYYDDTCGLSVTCEDTRAEPKLIGAGVGEGFVDLALWLRRPFLPGEGYQSPWVALRPCEGSWMAAAEDYRTWARQQWWAKPKRGESAPPAWLAESPLVLSAEFRPLGNGKWFVPPERWAEFARLWQEATGAHSVMIESRNWEQHGYYTSPDYFPLYPSPEVVAQTLSAVQEAGVRVQAMVAGLKWMIQREPFHTPHYDVPGHDGRERFERDGRAVCVVGRDGEVLVNKAYFTWDGEHAFMCPATEFAQEHFRNTARVLAQAGFDLFEFDQMNGGGCPPCYSTQHGHPPGEGTWIHEAIAELMRITREEGRKHNPEFALSLEDPAELLLPYLDTYISRSNHLTDWPASGPGSCVVPAFAYVYHPVMPSTNVDIQHTSRPDDSLLLRTARAFIAGAGLSTQLTPWQVLADYGEDDLFPTPDKMDAAQLALLRNLVRAHDGPGRPYLVQGEMLPAPKLGSPLVEYAEAYHTGAETETVPVAEPAVLHSAWRAPDGRQALFLVNVTRAPVTVALAAENGGPLAQAQTTVKVYVNGRPAETGAVSDPMELSVPALSAVMLEMSEP